MEQLSNAFSILIVGMVTVFIILLLVVLIGKSLILITNKYWPAPIVEKKPTPQKCNNSTNKIAAIVAAVDTITNGKGKITNIKKV